MSWSLSLRVDLPSGDLKPEGVEEPCSKRVLVLQTGNDLPSVLMKICRHLQRLGDYLRWGSSLMPALPWPSTISDAAIHWREGSKV
jgi:hypothetical protein